MGARRAILTAGVVMSLTPCAAVAGVANRGLPGASRTDPLAGMRWGVYAGPFFNSMYPDYEQARGRDRRLLAKIALRPQMFWFGAWFPDSDARNAARNFIASTTGGDPGVLTQVAVFRLDPWEGSACPNGTWNATNRRSYRRWIDEFASGIGTARVALVVQPDLPFAVCARSSAPFDLVRYAAQKFNRLPHTTVYIDAGARYWPMPFSSAVSMLEDAGIRHVRGFALDMTEFDSTGAEIEYGARLVGALAAAGIPGKHFVVSTAQNGAGFLNGEVPHPRVCHRRYEPRCVTLGIPPTTDVANPRWHLTRHDADLAERLADAYVWGGRPWLGGIDSGFNLQTALSLAESTPW